MVALHKKNTEIGEAKSMGHGELRECLIEGRGMIHALASMATGEGGYEGTLENSGIDRLR